MKLLLICGLMLVVGTMGCKADNNNASKDSTPNKNKPKTIKTAKPKQINSSKPKTANHPAKTIKNSPSFPKKPTVVAPKRKTGIDSYEKLTTKQIAQLNSIKNERVRRTKRHFLSTNEKRHDLWMPYIKDIGGAYIGVGADQNYSFAAMAGSKLVFLMDFDRYIGNLHRLYYVCVQMSPTIDEFMKLFSHKKYNDSVRKKALSIFTEKQTNSLMSIKTSERRFFIWWHKVVVSRAKRYGYKNWLSDSEMYKRWRKLVLAKRVVILDGDLTKAKGLLHVAQILKKFGLPMGVIYFSNAEEYWGTYHKAFRKAMKLMPLSLKGMVLRGTYMKGQNQADNLYHYSVQKLTDFVAWMKTDSWLSATYMVSIAKQLIKGSYFSKITGPTKENLEKRAKYFKKVKRLKKHGKLSN
jgi:hypothetical protein